MGVERRLAAVLAADVVGYSRLMGVDELGTLRTLYKHQIELIEPSIAAHKGRIVKTIGDGILVEFADAVDAVTCAVAVQSKMRERNDGAAQVIVFRVGINVGDIIIYGDDIFGDCVNIAARIENECEPGGVYLSGGAFEQIRGKTGFAFDDLGGRSLKTSTGQCVFLHYEWRRLRPRLEGPWPKLPPGSSMKIATGVASAGNGAPSCTIRGPSCWCWSRPNSL